MCGAISLFALVKENKNCRSILWIYLLFKSPKYLREHFPIKSKFRISIPSLYRNNLNVCKSPYIDHVLKGPKGKKLKSK